MKSATFFTVATFVFTLSIFMSLAVPPDVILTLQDLYDGTNGVNWQNNLNWKSRNPCAAVWYGINCDMTGLDMVSVKLNLNNLAETLNNSIGSLGVITYLKLTDNNLEGEIPMTIGNLSLGNYLSQSLPSELAMLSNLEHLYLSSNSLSGSLPALGQMASLQDVLLELNYLTSLIPTTMGSLTQLTQ